MPRIIDTVDSGRNCFKYTMHIDLSDAPLSDDDSSTCIPVSHTPGHVTPLVKFTVLPNCTDKIRNGNVSHSIISPTSINFGQIFFMFHGVKGKVLHIFRSD